jgi:cell division protein ZapA (FtsZ GTPase activity inhibitor)
LNVAHELLQHKRQKDRYTYNIDGELERLENKIEFALRQAKAVK